MLILLSCGGNESANGPVEENSIVIDLNAAKNYSNNNEIEVVTWNVKEFPQSIYTVGFVKHLLESWNADIYFLQEITVGQETELINMVNSMENYSVMLSEYSNYSKFALIYNDKFITHNSKKELWIDQDYNFAGKPPMENFISWNNGSKSFDLYLIGVHYKCCSATDGSYEDRRHQASLMLSDYILNNHTQNNVILLGDFNNVGDQNIFNRTLSPFTDKENFDSASSFQLTDLNILNGPPSGYSWQGWRSQYNPAHFDHIIINEQLFDENDSSQVLIISTPLETGISPSSVDITISDHQPVLYIFNP